MAISPEFDTIFLNSWSLYKDSHNSNRCILIQTVTSPKVVTESSFAYSFVLHNQRGALLRPLTRRKSHKTNSSLKLYTTLTAPFLKNRFLKIFEKEVFSLVDTNLLHQPIYSITNHIELSIEDVPTSAETNQVMLFHVPSCKFSITLQLESPEEDFANIVYFIQQQNLEWFLSEKVIH